MALRCYKNVILAKCSNTAVASFIQWQNISLPSTLRQKCIFSLCLCAAYCFFKLTILSFKTWTEQIETIISIPLFSLPPLPSRFLLIKLQCIFSQFLYHSLYHSSNVICCSFVWQYIWSNNLDILFKLFHSKEWLLYWDNMVPNSYAIH